MIPPLVSPPDRRSVLPAVSKNHARHHDLLAVYTGKCKSVNTLRRLTRTEQTACMC